MMLLKTKITLELLQSQNACNSAIVAAKAAGLPMRFDTLARKLNRADWALWELSRLGLDRKTLVLMACDCAETAKRWWPEGTNAPSVAIQTARKWARGKATIQEVRKAANATATYAAYTAAYAAAYAAATAAYAAYTADCAADAATTADYAAADDSSKARSVAHRRMLRLILARLRRMK